MYYEWDIFIAHAAEDKAAVARPLAHALAERGVSVWYDELTLRIGDQLMQSIDRGLASSRFGVVILSHAFFAKAWPQRELAALVFKERAGSKVVLPVWHNITVSEIAQYSLTLTDRLAADTADGLGVVADRILQVVRPETREAREGNGHSP